MLGNRICVIPILLPRHPRYLQKYSDMARLNVVVDSDDELPELSILLAKKTLSDGLQHPQHCQPTSAPTIQRVLPLSSREKKPQSGISAGAPKKQRSLKLEHVDSLRLPLTSLDGLPSGQGRCSAINLRSSPQKAVRYPPQQEPARASFSEPSNSEDDCSDHMSDFVVSDSESDDVYADIVRQSHVSLPKYRRQSPPNHFSKTTPSPRSVRKRNLEGAALSPKKEAIKANAVGCNERESFLPTVGAVRQDHENSLERTRSILKLFVFMNHAIISGCAEFSLVVPPRCSNHPQGPVLSIELSHPRLSIRSQSSFPQPNECIYRSRLIDRVLTPSGAKK